MQRMALDFKMIETTVKDMSLTLILVVITGGFFMLVEELLNWLRPVSRKRAKFAATQGAYRTWRT